MLLIMRERMLALIGTFTNETPIVRELANWVTERPPTAARPAAKRPVDRRVFPRS